MVSEYFQFIPRDPASMSCLISFDISALFRWVFDRLDTCMSELLSGSWFSQNSQFS